MENEDDNQEEYKGETEILDLSKPDYSFTPDGNHDWRQQGPYVICKSCDLEHAIYIGVNKHMIGVNEKGQPILKRFDA